MIIIKYKHISVMTYIYVLIKYGFIGSDNFVNLNVYFLMYLNFVSYIYEEGQTVGRNMYIIVYIISCAFFGTFIVGIYLVYFE
jgi:hypothetical protein